MAVLEGLSDPARPRKTSLASAPPAREVVPEQPAPASDPEGAIIKGEKRAPTFAEAKTMKEVYLAKMARLKYEEEAGRFLEKAEVVDSAAEVAEDVVLRVGVADATENGRMGRDHVISLILPKNIASNRVAEKIGERLERTIEFMGLEVCVYGITRA